MSEIERKDDGVITVFISLVILLIFSFVLTSIEYTRAYSLSARSQMIADISMNSSFASYAKEVFDEYGIMLLWKNDEEILESFETYADKNANIADSFRIRTTDYFQLKYTGADIRKKKMALDSDGELIENQICNYMKYALGEDIIQRLITQTQSMTSNEDMVNFNDKMSQCSEKLDQVIGDVNSIKDTVDDIQENYSELSDSVENIQTLLDEISSYDEEDIENRERKFDEFKIEYLNYREYQDYLMNNFDSIIDSSEHYMDGISEAKENIRQVRADITSQENQLLPEVYRTMLDEIDGIESEVNDMNTDIYHVSENREKAIEKQQILTDVEFQTQDISEQMQYITQNNVNLSSYDGTDFFIRLKEAMNQNHAAVEQLNESEFFNAYPSIETEGHQTEGSIDILNFVERLKNEGVMGYIIEGNISSKRIQNTRELPSKSSSFHNGANWNNNGSYENLKRDVLVTQYIFDKFSSYTDRKTNSLDYEVEYIITGADKDEENLKGVIDKLIAIREGFNFLYLLRNPDKKQEAYLLALAGVGFTGIPAVIRITQFLILGAWAYAESIIDVRDLLKGYKVDLFKSNENWNLSLEGALNLRSNDSDKEKRRGLTYEDYLRSLLMLNKRAVNVYRCLDLIQLNMQEKYNRNFKVQDCIVGVKVTSHFEAKRIFSAIGFVEHMLQNRNKYFEFEKTQIFEYR